MTMTMDDRVQGREIQTRNRKLTLDLERVSPFASTQTYSAMMEPFWSSLRYLFNCSHRVSFLFACLDSGWVWCGLTPDLQRPRNLPSHHRSVHARFPGGGRSPVPSQFSVLEDGWFSSSGSGEGIRTF